MYHIFISYRRQDSEDVTTRIAEWLTRKIPPTYVYFDTRSINPGDDFPSDIRRAVGQARVVLAVIGPEWVRAQATDGTFRRRIELPDDWVHRELALALHDPTKVVIPLLLHGENMPKELGLPPDIRPLVTLNFVNVPSESAQFEMAMVRVARRIAEAIPQFRLDGATLIDMGGPRQAYLEAVSERYRFLRLPMNPQLQLPLDTIYQPLRLHKDPFLPAANPDDPADNIDPRDQGERREERLTSFVEQEFQQALKRGQVLDLTLVRGTYAQDGEDALALSESRRLVILGKPGTGKTTLLYRLMGFAAQRALKDEQAPLPLFISLPQLARADAEYDLAGYLQTLPEMQNITHFAVDLAQAVQAGNIYLCMDGLDEVSPRQRGAIITWLNSLKRGERKTSAWIIGSRFAEYKGQEFASAGYVEWEMEPLDDEQRQKLARALIHLFHHDIHGGSSLTIRSPRTFVQALVEHNQAQSWRDNPMLFSLAAYVFVKQGRLPAARSDLYHIIIDAVLLRSEQTDADRSYQIKRAVAELALMLFQYQGRTFTRQTMRDYLPRVCQRLSERWDWPQMLKDIINSGLLDQVGREEYRFFHQTFHEYLAADALAFWLTDPEKLRLDDVRRFIEQKRTRSRWSEILSLMVGIALRQRGKVGAAFVQEWLHKLAHSHTDPDGDPGFLSLKQAIHTLVELPENSGGQPLSEMVLSTWVKLITTYIRSNRTVQRRNLIGIDTELAGLPPHCITYLAQLLLPIITDTHSRLLERTTAISLLGMGEAVEQLLPFLHDSSDDIRRATVQALAERATVSQLLPLLHDSDDGVRQVTVQAISKQATVSQLLPFLQDGARNVRQATVQAISKRATVEQLLPSLHDEDPFVRQSAVQALAERATVEQLLPFLHDEASNVRHATIQALAKRATIGQLLPFLQDKQSYVRQATVQAIAQQMTVAQLLPFLQDEYPNVRLVAVEALATMTTTEQLLPILGDIDYSVRAAVIQALAVREQVETVLSLLAQRDKQTLVAAITLLKVRATVEQLLPFLHDSAWNVRQATVQALAKRATVEQLLPSLHDESSNVRQATIKALAERATVEQLLPSLHDEESFVRQATVQTLAGRATVEQLLPFLRDEASNVRQATVQALVGQATMEMLLPFLQDETSNVRQSAIQVIASRATVEQLLPFLHDGEPFVRQAVIEALSERATVEQLLPFLHDEDPFVRQTAIRVLAQRITVKQLLPFLHDEDPFVRQTAIQALDERITVEQLLPFLHDEYSFVRQAAVRALAQRITVEQLLPFLHDEDPFVRQAAIRALAQRITVEQLLPFLHDEDPYVRQAAVQALAQRATVEQLLPLLQDGYQQTREAAIQGLAGRATVEQLLPILGNINGGVRQTAHAMIEQRDATALESVYQEAEQVLSKGLPGPILGAIYRSNIALTLGSLSQPHERFLQVLGSYLDWPYWQVRFNAAEALGKIQRGIPDDVITRLFSLRKEDTYPDVRAAADTALAQILAVDTIEDD